MRRAAPFLVAGVVLVSCAHGPTLPEAREATGDAVKDLRVAAEHARAALSIARLTCAALRSPDERALCGSIVARIEAALPKAQDILARVDACAGQDDEPECIRLAVDGANAVLAELQGGAAPVPAASSAAPAPSGSAP